jgi:hypothetical protein
VQDSTNPQTDTAEPSAGGFEQARCIIEVTAGIIPGTPMPEYTRRYWVTSNAWHGSTETDRAGLLAQTNGQAQGYAALLMLSPDVLNWVRTDWIWL